jgi:hypothetical protein
VADGEPEPVPGTGLLARMPGVADIELAGQVLARHGPQQWPYGIRCRNCHWPHPCAANRLAIAVLVRAGLLGHAG